MPFRETCVLDETLRFVTASLAGEETMTDLCARFGISRTWGYELVKRYRTLGAQGLAPRSRAPLRHGRARNSARRCSPAPGQLNRTVVKQIHTPGHTRRTGQDTPHPGVEQPTLLPLR